MGEALIARLIERKYTEGCVRVSNPNKFYFFTCRVADKVNEVNKVRLVYEESFSLLVRLRHG